jgi:hypothetical protein
MDIITLGEDHHLGFVQKQQQAGLQDLCRLSRQGYESTASHV